MTRRRPTALLLATALLLTLAPGAASAAADGVPLRPAVRDQADPSPNVVLRGRGWGHSVGLSQYGAYAMARAGHSHSAILQHYYPGTRLRTASGDDQQRVTVELGSGVSSTTATAVGGAVSWRICPVGGECRREPQPEGERWTVRASGSGDPRQVQLVDHTGTALYTGNGRVEAALTGTEAFEAASERVLTYHPSGQKQYAYGYVRFTGGTGGLSVTNLLPLEGYLRGLGEVPSSWGLDGGQDALEAQAIIARGYVLSRGLTTCATAACQVFVGYTKELDYAGDRWVAAVRDTRGRYLEAPGGGYATTFYSSSHGGRTEASEDSWAYGGAVPYLVSVDDPWSLDQRNPMRSWTTVASNAEFRRVAGQGLSRIQRVTILSRTAGGSPKVLEVEGPEGVRQFSTTPSSARSGRACNREGYAGNSLRCDLRGTVRNAAGEPFAGAGGQPPSSQIRTIGFAPFTDDDGNTHEYAIVWANAANIANGKNATTFDPRSAVTRAQMASFIYRTFDVPRRTTHGFRDVSGGPHEEAIASVAAAGIALGYDGERFGPSDPVTREQMASFLVRAMGLDPVAPSFSDVPRGGTHAGNVGALADSGVTEGCRPDRFCPRASVTRDQMASFLHRAVRYLR